MTSIYDIIREEFLAAGEETPVFEKELKQAVTKRGFTDSQFKETVQYYVTLDLFEYTDKTKKALRYAA